MPSENDQLIAQITLLKSAIYAESPEQLMELLREKVNVESISEYDVNDRGIKKQEEWGNPASTEYRERIKIDSEKMHNKPLLDVIEKKEPFFIGKGSKFLKRENQGSIFLIPNIIDNQVKRIYKVQCSQENELFREENTELFADMMLAVVNQKEDIQRREALIDIVKNITSKMSLSERLKEIVKIVDNMAFIDKCAIKLLEDDKLVVHAVSTNFGTYFKNVTSIEQEKEKDKENMATSAMAFLSNKFVYKKNLSPQQSKAITEGITSMLSVPLIAAGKTLGVINVFTEKEHEFSSEEMNTIEKFASLAAMTIMNARSYEKNIKMNEQLTLALEEKDQALKQLKQTQEKLMKAEKKAILGEIAVSVNHEINNPLTAIMLSAQVLKNKTDGESNLSKEINERTNTILEYINKIQQIIEKLSNASKADEVISKEYVSGTSMLDLDKF